VASAPQPFVVSDVTQIRALASPVRSAIVDALDALGPVTVVDLAAALGYPPDGLYYHLAALRRAGLIVEAAPEASSDAVRYDVPAHPVTLRYRRKDRRQASAISAVAGTMTRCAAREFRRALGSGTAAVDGPRRNVRAGRKTAWLTGADLEALNGLLARLHRLFERARAGRTGAELLAFTYVMSPIRPNGRRGSTRPR
jgi:DNA-binding transcriptional ArsR family regulator